LPAALLVLVSTGAIAQAFKPIVAVFSTKDLTNHGEADVLSVMIETVICMPGRLSDDRAAFAREGSCAGANGDHRRPLEATSICDWLR